MKTNFEENSFNSNINVEDSFIFLNTFIHINENENYYNVLSRKKLNDEQEKVLEKISKDLKKEKNKISERKSRKKKKFRNSKFNKRKKKIKRRKFTIKKTNK